MSEGNANEAFHSGTVSVRKVITGHVDVSGPIFTLRMADKQAFEFAATIMAVAATEPPGETGHG